MEVLKKLFNKSIDQKSPFIPDVERMVNYDEDGSEYITYEEVDYPKIVMSHGSVADWSLNALLAAGIDPSFPIHTGNTTRLQGVDTINDVSAYLDEIMSEDNKKDIE